MIPTQRKPTHPGEMLLEEFLQPQGMSQVQAAQRMNIPLNRLNEIVRGRRGITADTALHLAALLQTSAEFWMNLQSTWDIYEASLGHAGDRVKAVRSTTRGGHVRTRREFLTIWEDLLIPPELIVEDRSHSENPENDDIGQDMELVA